jgi:DNA-binding response OmpR family regulator
LLHSSDISVIVCATSLPDGTWHNVLHVAENSSDKPAVIVASSSPDEYLWAEVLNLGGFDVIRQPFNPQELRHVIVSAQLRGFAGSDRSRDGSAS